jgi:hypothetical protein
MRKSPLPLLSSKRRWMTADRAVGAAGGEEHRAVAIEEEEEAAKAEEAAAVEGEEEGKRRGEAEGVEDEEEHEEVHAAGVDRPRRPGAEDVADAGARRGADGKENESERCGDCAPVVMDCGRRQEKLKNVLLELFLKPY